MLKAHKFVATVTLAAILLSTGIAYQAHAQTSAPAAPPPSRLAVVNIVTVFSRLNEKIAGDKEIQDAATEINNTRVKKEDELRALDETLKKPPYKVDSPEYKKLQDDALQASMDLQVFLAVSEQKLMMMQKVKTASIYRSMNSAIEKYAKANGIAIVFVADDMDLNAKDTATLQMKIGNRKVLYSHPSYDITERLIEMMNTDYKLGTH